ncbi:MAG: hypothetical protein ACP5N1_02855 [Candidatus Woesearchaeota archaeon]
MAGYLVDSTIQGLVKDGNRFSLVFKIGDDMVSLSLPENQIIALAKKISGEPVKGGILLHASASNILKNKNITLTVTN